MEIIILNLIGMISAGIVGYNLRKLGDLKLTDTEYRIYQNNDGSSNVVIHYTRYNKTDTYSPLTVDDIIKLKAENVQVTDKPVRRRKEKEGPN